MFSIPTLREEAGLSHCTGYTEVGGVPCAGLGKAIGVWINKV